MSSAAMAVDAPKAPKLNLDEFIATALSSTPQELHPFFESFRTLHTRKLWHQLSQKLFQFFEHPLSKSFRVDVFERFVRDFETKLNQLRLVEMGVKVSKDIDNPQTHLTFLTSLLSRIDTAKSQEAHVLLLATIAHAKLLYGDLEGTKTDMDSAWKVLDSLESVDNGVNAAYYGVAADYYKAKAEYAPYYRNSLLYLACVDLATDMSPEERLVRAHDLGISAFLGDTIYNFGELLMHPILDALDQTPHEWIKKLLFTFNEGNIGKFEALAPLFPQEPILQENYAFLRQKICLMALIETVFKRNADNRTMSFQTIAEETRLPVDEVEHLVMKALSLKLIRGSLDQVDQKAHITWVQPRVLSREQIGGLAKRLEEWVNKLNAVEQRIAPEPQCAEASEMIPFAQWVTWCEHSLVQTEVSVQVMRPGLSQTEQRSAGGGRPLPCDRTVCLQREVTCCNIFSPRMAIIQVYAPLPLTADALDNLDALNWPWVHCLTFQIDTLNALKFSSKPYKWIRYAIGIVVGAQGDLSSTRDSFNIVDYDDPLPPCSIDLYYHINDEEKRRMFPTDPDIGRSSITSSVVFTEGNDFRKVVKARDGGTCVLSGMSSTFCDAVHLLPLSKDDEYIRTYTQRRSRDPTGSDIVEDIDSIKNGLLLNRFTHCQLGKHVAFLTLPNFAMDVHDVDPSAPPGKLCVAHLFKPDEPYCLGDCRLPSGCPLRVSASSDWPPAVLLDAVYAGAVIHHFGTSVLKERVNATWKETFYPAGNTYAVDAETKVERDMARMARRDAREDARRGDTFDLLMTIPYSLIPPDELRAKLKEKKEQKEAAEQRRLEDKVNSWMKQTTT